MRIRDTLKRKNQDLKQDLEQIARFVANTRLVKELEPYRSALLKGTRDLVAKSVANLELLGKGQESLLPDILSETSTLTQYARLVKFRYLRGIYRTTEWDRVCLQTISWLHQEHPQTRAYPAVFADDDVSIIPSSKGLPFYFFPCLEQRGLRFQPLFFHEFGHLLYRCHEQELDQFVGDFQRAVERGLLPASQRNDQYSQEQAKLRQSIVETWYKWVQEFFCDAVGLSIGGPAFLNAFSEYIGRLQPADYVRQASDLHGSTHPVSWLRIRLLTERAERAGFGGDAERILAHWTDTANLLRVNEDHYGFYTDGLKTLLVQTVDDMIVEASPYRCDQDEAAGVGWETGTLKLVALLNKVWLQYFDDAESFPGWESSVLEKAYGLRAQNA
jgi:hypothetical protein